MNEFTEEFYDMVIIGGGASGSGIALDASTRGYKVLLVDKDDFASGSSSKSSKLIHGGVRYLEKAIKQFDKSQYNLVKEALSERTIFLKNAPHLAKTLKLDTPIYKWLDIAYIYTGLLLYKLISGSKKIKNNEYINKTVLSLTQPSIKKENLKGAISFYDGRFIDSRMVIALLQTAQYYGLTLRNYHEAKTFIYDDKNKISGINIYDKFGDKIYKVKSKCIINASGANVDNIRKLDDNSCNEMMELSSGIHLVVHKKVVPYNEGLLIPKTSDGRVIFVLPYLDHCLIGTTDNKVQDSNSTKASIEEITYLINHVNEYFDIKITQKDILSSWSGIRPLIKEENIKSTQEVVREHKIKKSDNDLISIAGGKWTTYRKMAEELVDFTIKNKYLEKKEKCKTKKLKVIGSQVDNRIVIGLLDSYDLSKETKKSLLTFYGDKSIAIANLAKDERAYEFIYEGLPFIEAELIYAVKNEYVKKAIDFLARRISLCFIDKEKSLLCVNKVCELMGKLLLWDTNKIKDEKEETITFIKNNF